MEPSDEELLQAARDADLLMPDGSTGYLEFADVSELVLAFARAVLAHWGNYPAQPDSSPAPPAEDEVADLVAWMHDEADQYDCIQQAPETAHKLRHAAELLSIAYATGSEVWEPISQLPVQRHPTPVPVSERLPGREDCDTEGRCWWLLLEHECNAMWCHSPTLTHWLPATALPLPAGEVKP